MLLSCARISRSVHIPNSIGTAAGRTECPINDIIATLMDFHVVPEIWAWTQVDWNPRAYTHTRARKKKTIAFYRSMAGINLSRFTWGIRRADAFSALRFEFINANCGSDIARILLHAMVRCYASNEDDSCWERVLLGSKGQSSSKLPRGNNGWAEWLHLVLPRSIEPLPLLDLRKNVFCFLIFRTERISSISSFLRWRSTAHVTWIQTKWMSHFTETFAPKSSKYSYLVDVLQWILFRRYTKTC